MTSGTVVGLIANPASARDIRRLVADGAAITTNQKLNILLRLLSGLAAGGVDQVLSMSDRSGLSAGLAALIGGPAANRLPAIEFVDHPITRTATDTAVAVEAMLNAGVDAIAVLGGDGTNRVVAQRSGGTPLASISTGTNNAFPGTTEPTVVGMATALVARRRVDPATVTYRAKLLEVRQGGHVEHALVDVAIIATDRLGSGAVWDPASLRQIFLTFAEPQAIGLSSIGAHLHPVCRTAPAGLRVELGHPAECTVLAPLAPGRLAEIPVTSSVPLHPGTEVEIAGDGCVIAFDGERLLHLDADRPATVTLRLDGPVVIDIVKTMTEAARVGLLTRTPTLQPTQREGDTP